MSISEKSILFFSVSETTGHTRCFLHNYFNFSSAIWPRTPQSFFENYYPLPENGKQIPMGWITKSEINYVHFVLSASSGGTNSNTPPKKRQNLSLSRENVNIVPKYWNTYHSFPESTRFWFGLGFISIYSFRVRAPGQHICLDIALLVAK